MKGCVSHLIIYLPFCLKLDRHNPTDKVKQMNMSDINAKMVQCDASKLVIHNQQSCQYTRLWSIYRVRLLIIKLLLTSFLLNFEHPWNLYIPQKVLYSVKRVFRLIMFFKGIVYLKKCNCHLLTHSWKHKLFQTCDFLLLNKRRYGEECW